MHRVDVVMLRCQLCEDRPLLESTKLGWHMKYHDYVLGLINGVTYDSD